MKEWIKERWELIAGFILGIIGLLAVMTRSSNTTKKVLEGKDDLHKGTRDTLSEEHEQFVNKVDDANKKYDDRVEKIGKDRDNRLDKLKSDASSREKELLSKTPDELAEEMARLVEKSIIEH